MRLLIIMMMLGLTFYKAYPQQNNFLTWESLIGYFDFNGNYFDRTDDTRLIVHSNTQFDYGICGKSIFFNGADAYLTLPDEFRFPPQQNISLSFWIKTKQTDRFHLIEQRTGDWNSDAHNMGIYFNSPSGKSDMIYFHYPNFNEEHDYSSLKVNNHKLHNGEWHHLVFVKDVENALMQIYFNTRLIAERDIIDRDFMVNGELIFGKSYKNEHFFKGHLDNLSFFQEALTSEQVKEIYHFCDETDDPILASDLSSYDTLSQEVQENKILDELTIDNLEEGQLIQIKELYFDADQSEITPNSIGVLREIFIFLVKNPGVKVEIGGHTNSQPSHEYCDSLSMLRAESVAYFLTDRGIPKERIQAKGYGKRQPIARNDTKAGRQKNQRVELKILEIEKHSNLSKSKTLDQVKSIATQFWFNILETSENVKEKIKKKD